MAWPHMWPFRKRAYPPRDQLVVEQDWSLSEGTHDGRPMVARFNAGLRRVSGHPEYPLQVGVAVPFRAPRPDGLPDGQEEGDLEMVEAGIAAAMEAGGLCLFAGAISTGGMRQLIFYAAEPEEVRQRFERVAAMVSSHRLQLMMRPDPRWSLYDRFV